MKVIVIGGGAAGMMAALTAARSGHAVTLLEKQDRVGRKLMTTGNGRCNLSNLNLSIENYHGRDRAFAGPALEQLPVEATLRLFRELGLLVTVEPSGKVYPVSDQAGSVLDVLRFALASAGVETRTGCGVRDIRRSKGGFSLGLESGETVRCDKLILCCGGLAAGKLGGSKSGYQLLESLGHQCTMLYPALVQLRTDPTWVKSLKGVRADAGLTLRAGDRVLATGAGEVQFTEYGVSGPVVFELSRASSAGPEGQVIELDLLRSLEPGVLEQLMAGRQHTMPGLTLENLLTGTVHNRLGRTLIRAAGYDLNAPVQTLKAPDRKKIARTVRCFALPVTGNQGFEAAQVTAGGIATRDFDPETLESRLVPGLYAAGEVLDIDGDCGGYNLQWAWSSGYLAGLMK